MKRLLASFIAGTVATLPMSVVMLLLHYLLVGGDARSLPPYRVTMRTSQKAGFWHNLLFKKEEERSALALLAHFAYGGLAGMGYSLLAPLLSLPALLRGALYGLAFWVANYVGILPAMRLYPPNEAERADRRAVMITSHLVWGAALGAALEKLAPGSGLSSR